MDFNALYELESRVNPNDYRFKGDKLLLDYIGGFVRYMIKDSSDDDVSKRTSRLIINREYRWDSNSCGLMIDKVRFAKIEHITDDTSNIPDFHHSFISSNYYSFKFPQPRSYNVCLNINHCIYVVMHMTEYEMFTLQRYIEKDFGINRYVINTTNDIAFAISNNEVEWLNVFIEYIRTNKLWLERMLDDLNKPEHSELKTKVMRYLNDINDKNTEDIAL